MNYLWNPNDNFFFLVKFNGGQIVSSADSCHGLHHILYLYCQKLCNRNHNKTKHISNSNSFALHFSTLNIISCPRIKMSIQFDPTHFKNHSLQSDSFVAINIQMTMKWSSHILCRMITICVHFSEYFGACPIPTATNPISMVQLKHVNYMQKCMRW